MSDYNRDCEECEFNGSWCVECFVELPKEARDKEVQRIRMKRIRSRINREELVNEHE